jgi:hypothetical protein
MLVLLHITEFNKGGSAVSYLCSGPNVVKGGKGSVNKEPLADCRVKHFKPHIMRSISGGDRVRMGASVEGIAVNPLGRMSATLKHGDTVNLDILYV